jgi:SHS family lactate transporter-like MFS transporter
MTDESRARRVVIAAYLGWMLDAFDFFILIFVLAEVAGAYGVGITPVTVAVTLTLAMRPLGAFIFGRLADRYGRKPILMIDILLFAALEFLSGLMPTLATFLAMRALFGVAMGGEWGIGAALTMETIPERWRGWVSGLLQSGYPSGYLLATIFFGLFFPLVGWRGMFMLGALPALLVLYIRSSVPESAEWQARRTAPRRALAQIAAGHLKLIAYGAIVMMALNFFAHGTQDLYPSAFLGVQHRFSHAAITWIAIIYNVGGILGSLVFGRLSQRVGRRPAIILAALLALPVIPLWAFSTGAAKLAAGAFLMQVSVQGVWGVIPAYLNELSPAEIRATFPGFVYQLGNFLASANATIQAWVAARYHHDYAIPLAWTAAIVVVVIIVLVFLGPEPHGAKMGAVEE